MIPKDLYSLLLDARDLPDSLRYTPERFRNALRRLGLTQKEAAAALGVSKSAVSKWAASTDSPSHSEPPPLYWHFILALLHEHPSLLVTFKIPPTA
jgi:DNA-binding transcriptional regulator YiaG